MSKFLRWLFWRAVYCCRRQPAELVAYLTRTMRCQWPWKRFRPSAWHNDDGGMWHVSLTDEYDYTVPGQLIKVDLHVGREDGEVTGFNVCDKDLKAADVVEKHLHRHLGQ